MPNITCERVSGPTKEPPRDPGEARPHFKGASGDTNYFCATCGFMLAETIRQGQITRIAVVCPVCGSQNRFP